MVLIIEADEDDTSYDFDLLFVRRRPNHPPTTSPLWWLLPPAQTGFSACLWLRMSTSQTRGTILSLDDGSRTAVTSRDQLLTPDVRSDVTVTVSSRQEQAGYVLAVDAFVVSIFKLIAYFGL